MTPPPITNYWLDLAVQSIIDKIPTGTIVISSGISPSANYHIGHFREILTAEALAWGLRQGGRQVVHKHVVDDFDPLRKRYDFLPEWMEEFIGQPICLVPSPDKSEDISYADHFFNEFIEQAHRMGIKPTEVIRSYQDLYCSGLMVPAIEDSLSKVDLIRKVFKTVTNRQLEADWSPLQVLDAENRFQQGNPATWDKQKQTINGVDYTTGKVKLNWRLDWPARWRALGVQVEPFSLQEHGAAGSSYDTGVHFSKDVFGYPAPLPGAQYGNIHLLGDTKKMSSSKGNLVTPRQALEIMPPELLRYFVVRSRPEKTLYFDSGSGFYNLMNEYKEVMQAVNSNQPAEFMEAYKFASDLPDDDKLSTIPFQQLVMVYQSARGDFDGICELLARLNLKPQSPAELRALKYELTFVSNWLEKFAPEEVKFSLVEKLTDFEVSNHGQDFLNELTKLLSTDEAGNWEGEIIQAAIFQAAKSTDLPPREAFQLLYRLFINKDAGPKLGPFLASMEREFVLARIERQR